LPLRAGSVLDVRAKYTRLAPLRANKRSPDKAAPDIVATKFWRRERIATGCNFLSRSVMAESGGAKFGYGSGGIFWPRAAQNPACHIAAAVVCWPKYTLI